MSEKNLKMKTVKRNKIFIYFIAIVFFIIAIQYIKGILSWNKFIQNNPEVLLVPSKLVIKEIKKISNFEIQEVGNITLELPSGFKTRKDKRAINATLFYKDNPEIGILVSVRKEKMIPEKLKNKFSTDFDFVKSILYEKDDRHLLFYKTTIIPYIGDNNKLKIYEFDIRGNKGFLYVGTREENIHRYYVIFFDNYRVILKIMMTSNSSLSSDEINYIVSSIKGRIILE